MDAEDHKLLQFLAATVESIRDRMATKEDLLALRDEMEAILAGYDREDAASQEASDDGEE